MTAVKFPRRYLQRVNIRKRQSTASPKGRTSHNKDQAQGIRLSKGIRAAKNSTDRASDSVLDLESAAEYAFAAEYEGDEDSGYGSGDIQDEVDETYEEMRARYIAEGPVMPELSDGSKAMVKAEELRWKA